MTSLDNNSNDDNKIFSVIEAEQVNSGKITVIGMIISRSVTYKTISKSEWMCQNFTCGSHGFKKFDPPSFYYRTRNWITLMETKSALTAKVMLLILNMNTMML
jgi:hypothetical protein